MSAEISERIRAAHASGEALRIVGRGTWMDAGRPCAASARLDMSACTGVTRYEPGDFVLTARAGTTLDEIQRAAEAHGQWLTLDPLGVAQGTIGATIATGSYGPLASAFGTPRDHILGCEFVSGTGDVIRAGGQVVKNVAGFDLVRLVTGAWGTVGVLTEVTLRLRARPQVDRTIAIPLQSDGALKLWRWTRESEFTPLSAELVSASLATQLGIGTETTALLRLGGNDTLVRAAIDSAASLGASRDIDASVWAKLRETVGSAPVTFRTSSAPSHIGAVWESAMRVADSNGGVVTATVARGVIRCALPSYAQRTDDFQAATVVGERLQAEHWRSRPPRSTGALEARVRAAFDPQGILNPGIIDA